MNIFLSGIFNLEERQEIKPYFSGGLYTNYCSFCIIPKDKKLDESNHGVFKKIKRVIDGKDEKKDGNLFAIYGNIYRNDKIEKTDGCLWIYSTHTKNTKNTTDTTDTKNTKNIQIWTCIDLQRIPKEFELI